MAGDTLSNAAFFGMLAVTIMTDLHSFLALVGERRTGFVYCRTCFAVQWIGGPDDAGSRDEGEGNSEDAALEDERETFLRRHRGHRLVPLRKKRDRYFSDRPVWDPLRIAYEEVTDGGETFVVKSWRTNLHEPRQYALLRGALDIATTVDLPKEPLCEDLMHSLSCSPEQAEQIVKKLQQLVTTFPLEDLLPAYFSADDPHLMFSYLSERHLRKCVELCREAGIASDKAKLQDFFIQRQQEDALTLELRQRCELHFS